MITANENGYFVSDEVVLKYGEKYREMSEARDYFEEELCRFLKIIHECEQLNLKKWKWGWDCFYDEVEEDCYEKFMKQKPFMLDKTSRIYLFNYDTPKKNYYALCGFGTDIKKQKGEIVFITSIEAFNGNEDTFSGEYQGFEVANRYDGKRVLAGPSISLNALTITKAIEAVNALCLSFDAFKKKR